MLRNRSRAVTSKQALMADQISLLSPSENPSTPISSFLNSPRLFNGLFTKNHSDAETASVGPTSILNTKNASKVNPFVCDRNLPEPQSPCNKSEPEATGLALIGSLNQERCDHGSFSKPINRISLFGSKLKVQIPAINPSCLISPPESPADFGIKTRDSELVSLSPKTPAKDFSRQLSLKEMELSEDYTCVITHGPNPKTTHIFHNCIVENCCGEDSKISVDREMECGSESNFCSACKDNLEQGKDDYIYREEEELKGDGRRW